MHLSAEQEAIVNASFNKIMLVMAYAGSGKSFTLREFCRRRPHNSFLYFVFSKDMQTEAVESFSDLPHVTITTFHALAFSAIGKHYMERLREDLRPHHLEKFFGDDVSEENRYLYAAGLLTLLGDFAASGDDMEVFVHSKRSEKTSWSVKNGVPLTYLLKMLPDVWETLLSDDTIPFSHDFYLKLWQLSTPELNYDYILVDEGQDITPCMISIVVSQSSKIVVVGDTWQQIFSWRGAINSLEYLRDHHDVSVYYLSQSFRCPPKIGFVADALIQKTGAEKPFIGAGNMLPSGEPKMYIGRTNAGVLDHCIEHLDSKIYFVGGIKKYGLNDIMDVKYLQIGRREFIRNGFIANFASFQEFVSFANKTKDPSLKALYGIVFKYAKYDFFRIIRSLKETETRHFRDADFGVATCHKSKGLQFENVELLDDFPLGKRKKEEKLSPAELREENNLLYVGVTRAMCSLSLPGHVQDYLSTCSGDLHVSKR